MIVSQWLDGATCLQSDSGLVGSGMVNDKAVATPRRTYSKKHHTCPFRPDAQFLPVTRIRCEPNCISTGTWITPMSSPNATASNSGTICPRSNVPSDPPLLFDGHVDRRDTARKNTVTRASNRTPLAESPFFAAAL